MLLSPLYHALHPIPPRVVDDLTPSQIASVLGLDLEDEHTPRAWSSDDQAAMQERWRRAEERAREMLGDQPAQRLAGRT